MASRRNRYEPLQRSTQPRWLVIRNMHRGILEHRRLDPDSDLYGVFIKALAAHVDRGYQMEEFSSGQACAFCNRGDERRMIVIEYVDPAQDTSYRSFSPL
jgi:hypothetical protein